MPADLGSPFLSGPQGLGGDASGAGGPKVHKPDVPRGQEWPLSVGNLGQSSNSANWQLTTTGVVNVGDLLVVGVVHNQDPGGTTCSLGSATGPQLRRAAYKPSSAGTLASHVFVMVATTRLAKGTLIFFNAVSGNGTMMAFAIPGPYKLTTAEVVGASVGARLGTSSTSRIWDGPAQGDGFTQEFAFAMIGTFASTVSPTLADYNWQPLPQQVKQVSQNGTGFFSVRRDNTAALPWNGPVATGSANTYTMVMVVLALPTADVIQSSAVPKPLEWPGNFLETQLVAGSRDRRAPMGPVAGPFGGLSQPTMGLNRFGDWPEEFCRKRFTSASANWTVPTTGAADVGDLVVIQVADVSGTSAGFTLTDGLGNVYRPVNQRTRTAIGNRSQVFASVITTRIPANTTLTFVNTTNTGLVIGWTIPGPYAYTTAEIVGMTQGQDVASTTTRTTGPDLSGDRFTSEIQFLLLHGNAGVNTFPEGPEFNALPNTEVNASNNAGHLYRVEQNITVNKARKQISWVTAVAAQHASVFVTFPLPGAQKLEMGRSPTRDPLAPGNRSVTAPFIGPLDPVGKWIDPDWTLPPASQPVTPWAISDDVTPAVGNPTVSLAGVVQTISPAAIDSSSEVESPASINLTVPVAGVSSSEELGSHTLSVKVTPAAVPASDRLGAVAVSQRITPASISSSNPVGTATVSLKVTPASVKSGEALGRAQANLKVTPQTIGDSSAVGRAAITQLLRPAGVPSGERTNSPTSIAQKSYPLGIPSGQALGRAQLNLKATPAAIPSGEALGRAAVAQRIAPASILPVDRLGKVQLNLKVAPAAIPASDKLGSHSISLKITPAGISTGQALGSPAFTLSGVSILPAAIKSVEGLGKVTVTTGAVTLSPKGIASPLEGVPGRVAVSIKVSPPGTPTGAAVGSARVNQVISPKGIADGSKQGNQSISSKSYPQSIPSGQQVGSPAVTAPVSTQTIGVNGIPSAVTSGASRVSLTINAGGIQSGFKAGTTKINQKVTPSGITSSGTQGSGRVAFVINGSGIPSPAQLGATSLQATRTLSPAGIGSAAQAGKITITTGAIVLSVTAIPSPVAFGALQLLFTNYTPGAFIDRPIGDYDAVPGYKPEVPAGNPTDPDDAGYFIDTPTGEYR